MSITCVFVVFTDRVQAGDLLAKKLSPYQGSGAYVLGLARGGMIVASRIANIIAFPLDVLVVKKIPAPGNPELALGAIAPDGVMCIHWKMVNRWGVDETYIRTQISSLNDYIKQKTLVYRKGRKPLMVKDKTVILVDDGAATGATFETAIRWCRAKKAQKIVAAIPASSKEATKRIAPEVSELVTLDVPEDFGSVGQYYRDFRQVEDKEVVKLLR